MLRQVIHLYRQPDKNHLRLDKERLMHQPGNAVRQIATLNVILLALAISGIAQKDGAPVAVAGEHARPMAPNGVPAVVTIPAGTFRRGADPEALPASVTKGFGVMSARPDYGDF